MGTTYTPASQPPWTVLERDGYRYPPGPATQSALLSAAPLLQTGKSDEAFAWMEGVLMLATMAQTWRLRFVPGPTVDVQPKITLRPKYPMMFVPEPR